MSVLLVLFCALWLVGCRMGGQFNRKKRADFFFPRLKCEHWICFIVCLGCKGLRWGNKALICANGFYINRERSEVPLLKKCDI
jgi:hypothetical protein